LAKLLGYDYTIQYHSGTGNIAIDALSRIVPPGQCFILSIPTLDCLADIKHSVVNSSAYRDLLDTIQQQPDAHPEFSTHLGWIRYRGKLWLQLDNPYIPMLLNEFHSTPLGGHMGETKTLRRLKETFF